MIGKELKNQILIRWALTALFVFSLSPYARGEDDATDVKELVVAIESNDELACEEALFKIVKIGAEAKPAVDPICELLNSSSHQLRALSIDALVAIGEPATERLKKLLESDSSAVRAAALQGLGRLNSLTVEDVTRLRDDKDPKIRAAIAIGIGNAENDRMNSEQAVAILIGLLHDNESAVAVQACLTIGKKKTNPKIAVPALTLALARKPISKIVADTLSKFGTDAQSAVPTILEFSTEIGTRLYTDPTEEALEHIGPPSLADVLRICELLGSENHERTILVAEVLSQMNIKDKKAADKLETTIIQVVELANENRRKLADIADEEKYLHDNSGRILVAAECCLKAHRRISDDAKHFVDLVKKTAVEGESAVGFNDTAVWNTFADQDVHLVESLLTTSDPHVLESAMYAIISLGPRATQFVDQVIALTESEFEPNWYQPEQALAAMGPSVAEKSLPALVASFNRQAIELRKFANAIEKIGVSSSASDKILIGGLESKDQWAPRACAKALCATTKTPEETASLVTEKLGSKRPAIEALRLLASIPKSAGSFLVESLSNDDMWTRHEAIVAIGEMGLHTPKAVEAIKSLVVATRVDERLQAAKTLFLITGDADEFDKCLQKESDENKVEKWHRLKAAEVIGELGTDGEKFQHHLLKHQAWFVKKDRIEEFCESLKSIGSDESIKALNELTGSKDWKTKSAAQNALKFLK